jgi:hypothetical protein
MAGGKKTTNSKCAGYSIPASFNIKRSHLFSTVVSNVKMSTILCSERLRNVCKQKQANTRTVSARYRVVFEESIALRGTSNVFPHCNSVCVKVEMTLRN